jgi:hypothetical protein
MSLATSTSVGPACPLTDGSMERALFALAGSVAVVSALLVALVSPWFAVLTALAGANQLLFAAVGDCPVSLVLRRRIARRSISTTPEV